MKHNFSLAKHVCVLGGGLAGTSAAWALKQAGHIPTIIAPHGLADGASGNDCGLYNPRFSRTYSDRAKFYNTAFTAFYQFLLTQNAHDTGWMNNGTLYIIRNDTMKTMYHNMVDTWGWETDNARIVTALEASTLAGIDIKRDALWLPQAGSVNPKKLCALYARDIKVCQETPDMSEFDAIIIASGLAALKIPGLAALPLEPVRGQIITARATKLSSTLKTNVCYGGYMTPVGLSGAHTIGATFTQGDTSLDMRITDTAEILDKMNLHLGPLITSDQIIGARVGVRVTTSDHRPLIGRGPDVIGLPPLYLSLAHESHGILSTFLAAKHMAALITS